jgi:hypothetical protein
MNRRPLQPCRINKLRSRKTLDTLLLLPVTAGGKMGDKWLTWMVQKIFDYALAAELITLRFALLALFLYGAYRVIKLVLTLT